MDTLIDNMKALFSACLRPRDAEKGLFYLSTRHVTRNGNAVVVPFVIDPRDPNRGPVNIAAEICTLVPQVKYDSQRRGVMLGGMGLNRGLWLRQKLSTAIYGRDDALAFEWL